MADLEGLFAAHHPGLYRYFYRAVGQVDTARDLTQDVFVRMSRNVVPDRPEEARAWMFRIARNLVLDHYRHRRRHPESAPAPDEASRAASQDVELAVNRALASLAPVDRDVFLMREVSGLGYEEIAAACELTVDAVRSRIHRARLSLRCELAAPIATSRTTATSRSGRINVRTDT